MIAEYGSWQQAGITTHERALRVGWYHYGMYEPVKEACDAVVSDAVAALESVTKERDELRAEVERMRAVVDAGWKWARTPSIRMSDIDKVMPEVDALVMALMECGPEQASGKPVKV